MGLQVIPDTVNVKIKKEMRELGFNSASVVTLLDKVIYIPNQISTGNLQQIIKNVLKRSSKPTNQIEKDTQEYLKWIQDWGRLDNAKFFLQIQKNGREMNLSSIGYQSIHFLPGYELRNGYQPYENTVKEMPLAYRNAEQIFEKHSTSERKKEYKKEIKETLLAGRSVTAVIDRYMNQLEKEKQKLLAGFEQELFEQIREIFKKRSFL